MGVTYQRDSSLRFAVFRMTCGGVGGGSGSGGVHPQIPRSLLDEGRL